MTPPAPEPFVLQLRCGCPASLVRAVDATRAWQVLFGKDAPAKREELGVRLVHLDGDHEQKSARYVEVLGVLQKNSVRVGGSRWKCRTNHTTNA